MRGRGWTGERHQLRAAEDGGSHGSVFREGSIGIKMPFWCATSIASGYPASACRMTPIPGSVVSTRSRRRAQAFGAIGDHHHAGMLRVSDSHAAAVVDRNPGRAGRGIHQRIQQRPIGDGVGAVAHGFGFAIGRRHRSGIQMIAPDHDGRFNFSAAHVVVHGEAELGALAVAQPADARGQALELDAVAGEACIQRSSTSRCAGNSSSAR